MNDGRDVSVRNESQWVIYAAFTPPSMQNRHCSGGGAVRTVYPLRRSRDVVDV